MSYINKHVSVPWRNNTEAERDCNMLGILCNLFLLVLPKVSCAVLFFTVPGQRKGWSKWISKGTDFESASLLVKSKHFTIPTMSHEMELTEQEN